MINLREVCDALGVPPPAAGDRPVRRFVLDSREAGEHDLFFALPGGETHGGRFAAGAEDRGAVAVVPPEFAAAGRVVVPDPAAALRRAGELKRSRFGGAVVAVTGSVGKTTTRRLIAAVLSAAGRTVQSPRNFNNRLGVPVTLGLLDEGRRFAVVEVASSAPGEVADLASLVRPDVGVVTTVAAAHLDGLRTIEGVRREKWSLADAVAPNGPLYSADCPPAWVTRRCEVVVPRDVSTDGTATRFRLGDADLSVGLPGMHHAAGAALAYAVGRHFGVPIDDIRDALASVRSEPGRCHAFDVGGVCIIDDTYNSSPAAVAAALDLLVATPAKRRFAVLGDMLGLGDSAGDLHRDLAASVPAEVNAVFTVGPLAGLIADCVGDRGRRFADKESLTAELGRMLRPGDAVLVKGSRATRMERVVAAISQQRARSVSE